MSRKVSAPSSKSPCRPAVIFEAKRFKVSGERMTLGQRPDGGECPKGLSGLQSARRAFYFALHSPMQEV
jgi:hypothetical protein